MYNKVSFCLLVLAIDAFKHEKLLYGHPIQYLGPMQIEAATQAPLTCTKFLYIYLG